MRMILIVSLSLFLLAIAHPLVAAELAGTVYKGGVPTGNLSITVIGRTTEARTTEVRTDAKGGYRLDLPEGEYVLIIRGQRFPVTVSPGGTRKDIRF
jgi:hypothetical protein